MFASFFLNEYEKIEFVVLYASWDDSFWANKNWWGYYA